MSNEHSVAIVSFEGALKREIKRVRNELKKIEDLSQFEMIIKADGRVNDGDVKLQFEIDLDYDQNVRGDSLQAVLDEAMRRRGWTKIHDAKLLSYEKIPSDDSDESPI